MINCFHLILFVCCCSLCLLPDVTAVCTTVDGICFTNVGGNVYEEDSPSTSYVRKISVTMKSGAEYHVYSIAGTFGHLFEKDTEFSGGVVKADPYRLCSYPENQEDFKGKIVLVERGDCFFEIKAAIASHYGAVGVIILDKTSFTADVFGYYACLTSSNVPPDSVAVTMVPSQKSNFLEQAYLKGIASISITRTGMELGESCRSAHCSGYSAAYTCSRKMCACNSPVFVSDTSTSCKLASGKTIDNDHRKLTASCTRKYVGSTGCTVDEYLCDGFPTVTCVSDTCVCNKGYSIVGTPGTSSAKCQLTSPETIETTSQLKTTEQILKTTLSEETTSASTPKTLATTVKIAENRPAEETTSTTTTSKTLATTVKIPENRPAEETTSTTTTSTSTTIPSTTTTTKTTTLAAVTTTTTATTAATTTTTLKTTTTPADNSAVLQALSTSSIANVNDLQNQITSLTSIVKNTQQINYTDQQLAVNSLEKMAGYIQTNAQNMTKADKERIIADLLGNTFSLLEDSSSNTQMAQETDPQKIKEGNMKMLTMKNNLGKLALNNKAMNEPMTTIQTNQSSIYLSKTGMDTMNDMPIASGGNVIRYVTQGTSSGCAQVQTGVSKSNPYIWDNSSSLVSSPVLQLKVDPCQTMGRKKRQAQAVQADVEITTQNLQAPHFVNTQVTPGELVTHFITLSTPYQPVTVSVYPHTQHSTLAVYIGITVNVSNSDHVSKFQVPLNNSNYASGQSANENYEEQHTTVVPSDLMVQHSAHELHIAVECLGNCNSSLNLTYSYRLAEISCVRWDEVQDKWVHFNCQVKPNSTPTKVKFRSNLLGSLGAGVFVAPNTINFSTVFDNFGAKLVENIAVVMLLVAIILVYIPLAIACRRLDKSDRKKWMIMPLVGNNDYDAHQYEIHVYTGNMRNAGTDSNISIVIAGTEADTGVRSLSDGERKCFGKGDINSFVLKSPQSIGIPLALRIWHDNSGTRAKASWYLEKIVVVDIQTKNWYLFLCNNWLSKNIGDCLTERVFHLSTSDDTSDGRSLLQKNLSKMFTSDHLWFSVGYRKTRSVFTRVQRLSCCLATLMLSMLASAMWYGKETEVEARSAINIGPLSITVLQLYTSVMSCLIVAPPILLLILIYEKVKPSKSDKSHVETIITEPANKKGFKLPRWCVYVAHVLLVLCVLAGMFFTILYALEWGKKKSEDWVGCIFMTTFESIIVIQPFKVLIVIILYSLLFKSDIDTSEYEVLMGKMIHREAHMTPLNKDIIQLTDAPSERKLAELKRKKELDKKMVTLFYEVFWQVVFIIILLWILVGNQDRSVFLQNTNFKLTFTSHLEKIKQRYDTWEWMSTRLLPELYWTGGRDMGYDEDSNKYLSNRNSIRLGPPRLRQLRVNPEQCTMVDIMTNFISNCSQELHLLSEDTTHYKPSWVPSSNVTQLTVNASKYTEAFTYKTAWESNSLTFWGRVDSYPGGGYIANLGESLEESTLVLKQLEKSQWVDKYTRVIFVEFNTWNPSSNLFSFVTISMEFPITGGVEFWQEIKSVQLYRYVGGRGIINILAECIALAMGLAVLVQEIYKIVKSRCGYFHEMWNVVTFVAVVFYYTAVGLYAHRCILTVSTLNQVMNNKEKMVSFNYVTLAQEVFISLLGFSVFLLQLRLLYALRYVKMIKTLGTTLIKSGGRMASVGGIFAVILLAFICLFYLMYGSQIYDYHSFIKTASTFTMITMDFRGIDKFAKMTSIGFADVAMIFYAFLVLLIVINLFISILNDFLVAIKSDKTTFRDNEVINHILQMFVSFLPGQKVKSGKKSKKKHNKSERDLIERISDLEVVALTFNDDSPIKDAVEDFLSDYWVWKEKHQKNGLEAYVDCMGDSNNDDDINEDTLVELALGRYHDKRLTP